MTLENIKHKRFSNGVVYLLHTDDGYPIETTDTFLPFYTKDCKNNDNALNDDKLGSRSERWMIGVSTMSGCPVRCKFCATGKLKRYRNLTSEEMVEQIEFIILTNKEIDPADSQEFKINWTRMGEPFLNITNVRAAMDTISEKYPNVHHYVSTIGIKGADYSWIKGNTTLQLSLHSFDEEYRNWLIPFKRKIKVSEMGDIRTQSNLKTTLNLTMAREEDFDIKLMKEYFDIESFFVKISPINENDISISNDMGAGIIKQQNII